MNRNLAIILTALAAMFCGCPGLGLCVSGILTATGQAPYEFQFEEFFQTGTIPSWIGYVLICVALILVLVPIIVGILTLRKTQPAAPRAEPPSQEPLPPPS